MDFSDLVDAVVQETDREDLADSGIIQQSVQQATLEVHATEWFPKDLTTKVLTLPEPAALVAVNMSDNCPRFRSRFLIVAGYDIQGNQVMQSAEKQEPDTLFDPTTGLSRSDVYYIAGRNLNIRFRSAVPAILLSYYTNPIVMQMQYNSWIADEFPLPIIHKAAMRVARITKDQELHKVHASHYAEKLQLLHANYLFPL